MEVHRAMLPLHPPSPPYACHVLVLPQTLPRSQHQPHCRAPQRSAELPQIFFTPCRQLASHPSQGQQEPRAYRGPAPWRTTKHVTRRQDTRLGGSMELERWAAWGVRSRLPATAFSQLLCGGPSEKGAQTL